MSALTQPEYSGPVSLPFRTSPDGPPDEPRGDELTLPEAYRQFVLPMQLDCAAATRSDYKTTVTKWQNCFAALPLGEIDERSLIQFRDYLDRETNHNGDPISKSTKAKHLKNLRHVLRVCGPQAFRNPRGQNLIARIPYVPVPTVKKKDRVKTVRVIPVSKVGTWYTGCRKATWPHCSVPAPLIHSCLLVLMYTYGINPGDAYGLLWGENILFESKCPCEEIELEHAYGWLHYTRQKTDVELFLPLSAVVRAHLELMVGPRSRVFPVCTRVNSWLTERRRIQKLVGIETPYTFQELRKTANNTWKRMKTNGDLGIAVLGHREKGINAEYYTNQIPMICDHIDEYPYPDQMTSGLTCDLATRLPGIKRRAADRLQDRQLRLF